MNELTRSELSLVSGGKTASGGKSPGGFSGLGAGAVNTSVQGSVSSSNQTKTNININCSQEHGPITYKESWGGLVKELQCNAPAPSSPTPSGSRAASSPGSGAPTSTSGKLQAYYWQGGGL